MEVRESAWKWDDDDEESLSHRSPHRSPHRSLGIPRNFREFPGFFWYFRDFWSNIRVFGQNNLIFELLQQK